MGEGEGGRAGHEEEVEAWETTAASSLPPLMGSGRRRKGYLAEGGEPPNHLTEAWRNPRRAPQVLGLECRLQMMFEWKKRK